MKNSMLFITRQFKSLIELPTLLAAEGREKVRQLLGAPDEPSGMKIEKINLLNHKMLKIAAVVALLILGVYFLIGNLRGLEGVQNHGAIPVYEVKKSKFQNKIVERGALKAVRSLVFSSEIPGNQAKVVKMVPEGTYVNKGDLLIAFDQTQFLGDIEKFKTEIERARNEVIKAEEDLKTEKIKVGMLEKTAENDMAIAELDYNSFIEGKGPLMINKSKATLEKTKTGLERTKRDYDAMQDMLKVGYITQIEMEQMESKLKEAQNNYEFARLEYEHLTKFTYPSELENVKAKVNNTKEARQKLRETIQSILVSKEAAVQMNQAGLRSTQDNLNRAREQLKKTRIYSPIVGFVVYRTIEFPGQEKKRVQIGDSVWQGQEILFIPDMSKMLIETRIREVDIYKIKVGQKAEIKFDAFPDLTVDGHVSLIGTLAKSDDGKGGIKYFTMEITLDGTDKRLRPGMTARSEILVYEEDNAIAVPVDAVFEKGGKKVCYVVKGDNYEVREVVTGMSNENFVLIKERLEEGEKVLLADPARL